MQVIAEDPWNWFLFDDEGKLYLEVLVEYGAVSFSVTTELGADQVESYSRDGAKGLGQISNDMRRQALMQQWHPGTLPPDWAERSVAAVHDWQRRRRG